MPRVSVDPASLEGEALRRWYLRTPDEIDAERRATADQRYQDFYNRPHVESDFAPIETPQPAVARNDDVLWMPNGGGGYRAIRGGAGTAWSDIEEPARPSYLPANPATREAAEFQEIGNPHNPRLRREWEIANGRAWPRTLDGQPYDVAHIRAIADGGTNTLDNIRPMEPSQHRASHKEDSSRWGKRSSIARAFGGKVEPPAHAPKPVRGPTARGLGVLGLIPNITGILSGRVRTDNFDNFTSDMLGYPSQEDIRHRNEEVRRRYFPNSKPGDLVA
ncbi:HNH endonuclease signature motif containing protein [Phenylobacterium sp.]|uniref:HNH endonuclease signature motif containing protein n=1 Tax=Phenylobacterium sp. TaxID=1871053 RepID=UPI00301DE09E